MAMPLGSKERLALGQERRKQMRRLDHAVWKSEQRREGPLKLMEGTMRGRVPALVSMKSRRSSFDANRLRAVSVFGLYIDLA